MFRSTNGASTSSGATRPDRAADRRIASLTPLCAADAQYDAVREVLAASQEGALAEYAFTPPAVEMEAEAGRRDA